MKFLSLLRPDDTRQQDRLVALWGLGSSVLYVTTLWVGFHFDYWGLNAALFLFSVLGLFLWAMRRKGLSLMANLYWIVPVGLICFSYLLFTNPFVKAVNLLVLPAVVAVFYGLAHTPEAASRRWNGEFVAAAVGRFFSPLGKLAEAFRLHGKIFGSARQDSGLAKRIVAGVVLMLIVVVAVVLPLLSSADASFGSLVDGFLSWFQNLLDATTAAKTLVAILLALLTSATLLAWGRAHEWKAKEDERPIDSVIVGIVLGGLLVVYLVFLMLQAKKLVTGQLPFSFAETVYAVKSGFWQLIALSALNLMVFTLAYRRTAASVQGLLAAFSVASLLLVFSAAHRMGLYVTYYGFSYEKFYASLAVVFCVIMFGFLMVRLVRREPADALRFAAVLFLWMYAVAAVFPVEQFVWRTNVALTNLPGSRIRLYELTMLSTDVWGAMNARLNDGTLAANEMARVPNYNLNKDNPTGDAHWKDWLTHQRNVTLSKRWYQFNLSDVFTMMDMAGR